ncbi:hypothetical protein [Xanthocytophaga agilis]|uniref:Fibronectin type-III domain-containing protein n=1 Tax=Xanthocytophaga agilis TaxID=3048010 RepID=A0AAE3RC69_9BACT|nr:hypothetical protein [Xanthocytophaga agilis]MDJ1504997.1 hypothetical protein [Xanthocytophaga agilis]
MSGFTGSFFKIIINGEGEQPITYPAPVLSIENTNPFASILSWPAISRNDLNIYYVDIAFDAAFTNLYVDSQTVDKGTNTGTISYTEPGVNPQTQYYARARALYNDGGLSAYSNVVSWITPAENTNPGFSQLTMPTQITGMSARLAWTGANSPSYEVFVATDENYTNKIVDGQIVTDTFYELSGLIPDQEYFGKIVPLGGTESNSVFWVARDRGVQDGEFQLSGLLGFDLGMGTSVNISLSNPDLQPYNGLSARLSFRNTGFEGASLAPIDFQFDTSAHAQATFQFEDDDFVSSYDRMDNGGNAPYSQQVDVLIYRTAEGVGSAVALGSFKIELHREFLGSDTEGNLIYDIRYVFSVYDGSEAHLTTISGGIINTPDYENAGTMPYTFSLPLAYNIQGSWNI